MKQNRTAPRGNYGSNMQPMSEIHMRPGTKVTAKRALDDGHLFEPGPWIRLQVCLDNQMIPRLYIHETSVRAPMNSFIGWIDGWIHTD